MKHMKKLIALLLCLAMFVSVLPLSVFAAEGTANGNFAGGMKDTAVIFTDLHTSSSNYKQSNVTNLMGALKNAGLPVSSVTSGGDAFSVNSDSGKYTGYTSTLTGYIRDALGDSDMPVNYVWSDHDRYAMQQDDSTLLDKTSHLVYGAGKDGVYGTNDDDNYYVYVLSMGDLSSNDRYNAGFAYTTSNNSNRVSKGFTATVEQAIANFQADAAKLLKDRPLLIVSHQPLLDRRNDNAWAENWCDAINEVATGMDVAFFFGHNHKYDSSSDYYYAKGSKMPVASQSGWNWNYNIGSQSNGDLAAVEKTLNFYHICAGYMEPTSTGSYSSSGTRRDVVMTVTVTNDKLQFTTYDKNGIYTGNYSLNETVDRAHGNSDTPKSVAVTGKIDYTVGDKVVAPSAVNVTYQKANGTTYTAPVDSGYALTKISKGATTYPIDGFTFTEVGEYSLTYTCTVGNYQALAELKVTVEEPSGEKTITEFDDSGFISVSATALDLTGMKVTNVSGDIAAADDLFSDYVAVNVALEGHTAGNPVKYSIALVEGMDTANLALYYIAEDGTATPLGMTIQTAESGYQYVEFTTTYVGTFAYGVQTVPDGYTLHSLTLENIPTNLLLGSGLDITNAVITATYTKAGAEDFVRKLSIYDFDVTNFSGYDVNEIGAQTAVFTYEGLTATLDIYVWGSSFANTEHNVTVAVGEGEFGVTNLQACVLPNTSVEDDVQHLFAGTNYVAYDIALDYESGFFATNTTKTVTLPIPAGVEKPVVYYVPGDGSAAVWMNDAVVNDDGTITFTTDHFSVYVVGETAEITVPDPGTQSGTGSVTTTTKKDVYVLVSKATAGKQYIIVSRNSAGTGYALKENTTTGASVTVKAAGNGISAPYIETTDETIMWNATNGIKFQSENGGYYLRYNRGLTFSTRDSTNWSYSNNRLSYKSGNTTYYLRYNNGWSASDTRSNVYLYEKQTIEVETTTTVSGIYSIVGNPAEETKVVKNGSTLELGASLIFAPNSGSAITTNVSTTARYALVEGGDPNETISGINGNVVTFTGKSGKALVKVSYTTEFGEVTNYIQIQAAAPTYKLTVNYGDKVVSGTTLAVKEVTDGKTITLTPNATLTTADGTDDCEGTYTWHIPEEYHNIATVDPATGEITFKGVDGAFYVTVTFTENVTGKTVTTGVNISATTGKYSTPTDGTNDFPEYPNPGSIRYDKTAEAVGNFSQTGIAKLELSMSGVPFSSPKSLDVVLMLDHSNSMTEARMAATRTAVKLFVENIVKNEDGTFNNNRIYVGSFAGGNPEYAGQSRHEFRIYEMTTNEDDGYQIINNQAELDALIGDGGTIDDLYYKFSSSTAPYGTEYDQSLAKCYDLLSASKADGNQQFCVFMSDGIPNVYRYGAGESDTTTSSSAMAALFDSVGTSKYATRGANYQYEYWSSLMKAEGVTVYAVGLGLNGTNSSLNGATAAECERVSNFLLNDISGPAGETADKRDTGTTITKKDKYFFSVADSNAAADMADVFGNISEQILDAARDVVATDKISDDYTMIFEIPAGVENVPGGQEFYIEVLKYALDAEHERTGEKDSLCKLYLGKNANGEYFAAKDANGTPFETPTFTAPAEGKRAYWAVVDDTYKANANDIIIKINGVSYKFMEEGNGTVNMTAGAYAYGTTGDDNTSQNLIIITPHFAYSAEKKMLAWTADKLVSDSELALQYFLYLDNSAGKVGEYGEKAPGAYETNQWAYITYTNHLGHECRQEYPVPQMTWNGAQVSYVFYLVDTNGRPINKSGEIVDFANATFITQIYTESVVWNDQTMQGVSELNIQYLAQDKLTSDYKLYDDQAKYSVHVFENEKGTELFNYFIIEGGEANGSVNSTTKVYNTKGGTKYSAYGIYSAHPAGSSFQTTDAQGESVTITTDRHASLDYAATTVAFAVVWQPKLVEDTVVVDFGLDVLIDVVQNDNLKNTITGIGLNKNVYGTTAMNTGVAATSKLGTEPIITTDRKFTISIENENQIRFHQNGMAFTAPVEFYYESSAAFTENGVERKGFMYSKVTVIPATSIYYEDSFISQSDLKTYEWAGADWGEPTTGIGTGNFQWQLDGTTENKTQSQDRPGTGHLSAVLDANNKYGYDAAYKNMSTHSMGSALKVHVDYDHMATASFSFYGTGFDLISMTSNTTGTIIVNVYDSTDAQVKSFVVNTYYGMTYVDGEWVTTDSASPNALYQVPVMKIEGLTYGQYTAEIKAVYDPIFDQGLYDNASYDFYLDAIRIYDPTGNLNDTANDAYKADDEGWPLYKELRNLIVSADSFGSDVTVESEGDSATTEVGGAVFIDGIAGNTVIANYESFGPNNELYLAPGQSVAFRIADVFVNANGEPVAPVDVQLAVKSVGGAGVLEIFNPGIKATEQTKTEGNQTVVTTTYSASKDNLLKLQPGATDLYYSIKDLAGGIIVISNPATSTANTANTVIISITNLKFTFGAKAEVVKETTVDANGITVETEASVLSISEEAVVYAMRSLSGHSTSSTVYYDNPAPTPDTTTPNGNAPEDNTTEDNTTDDNTSEDNTSDDNTSEDNTTDDDTSKDDTVDDDTTEEEESGKDEATEPEEELGWFARILRAIGNFFRKIFGWIFN